MRRTKHVLRGIGKGLHFSTLLAGCALDFIGRVRGGSLSERARWNQKWCRHLLRALAVSVDTRFTAAPAGLIVGNHLGYLDILVLGAQQPLVFVAKAEVRSWPVLGWLTQHAGTIFIRRDRRSDLLRVRAAVETAVATGATVAVFPEGTSSDGRTIRPFHPGLFVSAAEHAWPVTPFWLAYELDDGSVADEVCYWREMTFLPHFLNLLTKRRIIARLRQGSPLTPDGDRKQLSLTAHNAVVQLAEIARNERPFSKVESDPAASLVAPTMARSAR